MKPILWKNFQSAKNGAVFRVLNIIDDYNREVLNVTSDRSISSVRVIRELSTLIEWRGFSPFFLFDTAS